MRSDGDGWQRFLDFSEGETYNNGYRLTGIERA